MRVAERQITQQGFLRWSYSMTKRSLGMPSWLAASAQAVECRLRS
jgi:hypothetical protein